MPTGVDPEVVPYVQNFEKWGQYMKKDPEYKVPKIHIGIGEFKDFNFRIVSPNAIGVCYYLKRPRVIVVDKRFWDQASPMEREMVVFHELGHCALNRPHKTALDPWGRQISLMYPSIFNPMMYRSNREYYINELFNPY